MTLPLSHAIETCNDPFPRIPRGSPTSTDGFSLVEEVENVTRFLVMDPENGPERLHFPFSLVRFGLG